MSPSYTLPPSMLSTSPPRTRRAARTHDAPTTSIDHLSAISEIWSTTTSLASRITIAHSAIFLKARYCLKTIAHEHRQQTRALHNVHPAHLSQSIDRNTIQVSGISNLSLTHHFLSSSHLHLNSTSSQAL
ncbi:Hypothetical protein D9617_2g058610 [Elsinoe fawcettii]|nr:Hypothetical protein D9617_2g058610 [Elsinoe fawcettii]